VALANDVARLARGWRQKTEYLAINPVGKVPVPIDDSVIVHDPTIINEYLEGWVSRRQIPGKTISSSQPCDTGASVRGLCRRLSEAVLV
jgi:hypothetical protein